MLDVMEPNKEVIVQSAGTKTICRIALDSFFEYREKSPIFAARGKQC